MAESDWSFLANSTSAGTVDRGVTTGIPRPNGGGNFVFGFASLDNTVSAVGLYHNGAGFDSMAKGGSIRGAIKRSVSAGPIGFSAFYFIGAGGSDISDVAYLIGVEDDDPHQIVLRKGQINLGLGDESAGSGGILAKSTATYSNNTWLHIRLDMIVNGNGDVLLQSFENDLDTNPVTAPVWTAIPGMEEFIDDTLAINSGTAPLTAGRAGFGFESDQTSRRAAFDQIELLRQV